MIGKQHEPQHPYNTIRHPITDTIPLCPKPQVARTRQTVRRARLLLYMEHPGLCRQLRRSRHVPDSIPVIFTTAYDHYALQAFRFNSIDYLLKPIDSEELHAAIQKVKTLSATPIPSHTRMATSTTTAIAQILQTVNNQTIRYRERFLIPHRADEFLIIPVSDLSHITIRDGVVRLCTIQGKRHTLNMTLEEVESQLDPQRFMRVNRQFIISAADVQKLSTHFLGKMRIHMTAAPDEEIIVSKDKVASVKRWLDS